MSASWLSLTGERLQRFGDLKVSDFYVRPGWLACRCGMISDVIVHLNAIQY
jgi:hypothetical protein